MEEIKKFPPIEVDLGTVSKLTDRAVSRVLLQNPWKLDEIHLFSSHRHLSLLFLEMHFSTETLPKMARGLFETLKLIFLKDLSY